MINPNAADSDKLKQARDYYELACDHFSDCDEERRLYARCHHNTGLHGQWPEAVIAALDQKKRPHFTFNMVAGKVNSFLGMQRDARRSAAVKPRGKEDRFLASVVDELSQITKKRAAGRADATVLKQGAVRGEGDGQVYVTRSKINPMWIEIGQSSLPPEQVRWDPAAIEQDRSDARFVGISTWMDKGEFAAKYPDHATHFDTLEKGSMSGDASVLAESTEFITGLDTADRYSKVRSSKYYFDQRRKMIRVISMEYKWHRKVWYLTNAANGEAKRVDDITLSDDQGKPMSETAKREFLQLQIDAGIMQDTVLLSSDVEEVYWLEFVGSTILYDEKSPQPYDGFSVEPFLFYLDDETNYPYSPIRNYMDPQVQFNKSYTMMIEAGATQAKPGQIAEESAIGSADVFEQQLNTSGSVALVKDGKLGAVRERTPPQASTAAQQRIETDIRMLDRVSMMFPENESSAQAESALTHQLRDHKARLSHMDPMENFEDYQIGVERRRVQAIIRAMPDTQIEWLLGDSERFQVQRGPQGIAILELQKDPKNPQAQPQVINFAPLEKLRTLETDIELQASAENTSQQAIELGLLLQIAPQVPIHPDLLIERGVRSLADQELAKEFAQQTQQQQAEAQQTEAKRLDLQVEQVINVEKVKVAQRQQEAEGDQTLQAQKQGHDFLTDILTIWERADGAEKQRMFDALRAGQPSAGLTQ